MAATPLVVTSVSRDGVDPVAEVAADTVNGNSVANDGRTWVEVSNTDGAAQHTVTFAIPGTVDSQPIGDRAEVLPASMTGRRFGPFPTSIYGLTLGVTADDAQVTLAAYRLPSS